MRARLMKALVWFADALLYPETSGSGAVRRPARCFNYRDELHRRNASACKGD